MLVSDADLAALNIPIAYRARLFMAIEHFKRIVASGTKASLPSLLSSFMSSVSALPSAPVQRAPPQPPPPVARRKPCKFFVESHCRFGTFSHDKEARRKFQASLANK